MIEITNMSYGIPGGNPKILSNVDAKIERGEFIGLLGRNGAGKTTLIDLIMGFREPREGEVKVFGENPVTGEREVFSNISYLSQDISLKENLTIKEFLSFHSFFFKNYSLEKEREVIEVFGLQYNDKIASLSTGQRRRVQIVAAFAANPKILIIDEITAVLDPEARHIFFELLTKINNEEKTAIILATNIVEDLLGRINKLYFIDNSNVTEHKVSEIDKLFNVRMK